MKTFENFDECANFIVNNDAIINKVIELRAKYKKDSKSLTDDYLKETYQETLKLQLCDNPVVAINKRPFGFTIKVGKNKVRIGWKDVNKGATARLVATILKK